jgi:DNA repair exonuclease SbcCD ATPase subunit
MSQDVAQWLAEIKSLQQQVAQLQQEYEEAQSRIDRWRELYNQEAEQRRKETKVYQNRIDTLQSEIQLLKQGGKSPEERAANERQLWQELNRLETDEIKQKLLEAIAQIDQAKAEAERLREALSAEQIAHEQTRKSLTTALGDTVELLTGAAVAAKKKRPEPTLPGSSFPSSEAAPLAGSESVKNPLLQLPPLD